MSIPELTPLELEHVLAVVRMHREHTATLKLQMEEKLRLGWDGTTGDAVLACDSELHLLDGIIAKLWCAVLQQGK